jgi:hypothetical protein
MNINKEKLKKIAGTVFDILGSISIALVVIFLFWYVIPLESSKSSRDTSYEPSDYYSGLNSSDAGIEESDDYENSTSTDIDKEEIKTGEVYMVVDDLDAAKKEITEIKDKYNADITYSYESGEGVDRYVYQILKVEAGDFEDAYAEVLDIDGEVEYSNTDTTDVTAEYVDLESRLNNLKAVETQLLEIMETADTVEDTLAVYTELSDTRTEIEVLEGQIRYLDNQTDYSYITINLSLSSVGADIEEKEWKPYGVVKDAFRSFVNVLKGFVNVLIWILVFSPIVLVGVGVYLLVKRKGGEIKK